MNLGPGIGENSDDRTLSHQIHTNEGEEGGRLNDGLISGNYRDKITPEIERAIEEIREKFAR